MGFWYIYITNQTNWNGKILGVKTDGLMEIHENKHSRTNWKRRIKQLKAADFT